MRSFFCSHRNPSRKSSSASFKPQQPAPPYSPPYPMNATKSKHDDRHNSSSNDNTFQPNVAEMKKVFDKFDTNKDGKISQKEYKAALRSLTIRKKGDPDDEEEAVKKAFEAADVDNDGYIDFNEFMEVQKTDGGIKTSDITNAFKSFDLDGDGKISAKELLQVLTRMGESCNLESCKKMVRGVDRDGDGLIDMNEFLTMMTSTMKLV